MLPCPHYKIGKAAGGNEAIFLFFFILIRSDSFTKKNP
jgi:hypothetical protein